MNILHMKYAYEVAKAGSLSKASEKLLVAVPNLSRSIKELEADLNIAIFDRTTKGMELTFEGEVFMSYAKNILRQIDSVEKLYKGGSPKKRKLTVSVPRASYISSALTDFSKTLGHDPVDIFYKETNSQRTIENVLSGDYKLGIIRYAAKYEKYFDAMLEEKGLAAKVLTEFSYEVVVSEENPLAKKKDIQFSDLYDLIEIAHADPYVPTLPISKVVKAELSENISRRIFVFERASQFEMLSENPETFMWVSPLPEKIIKKHRLATVGCDENKKIYKDVIIYKKEHKFTEIENEFIKMLIKEKDKYKK